MALILLTGTAGAIIVRIPEGYPWWYTTWLAITGGTATGTIAWSTAFIYTLYEEINIMVLSHIVRERDRKAAEAQQQKVEAQQQKVEAQQQKAEAQQQELDVQQQKLEAQQQAAEAQQQELDVLRQNLAEKEQALQRLAGHLPPEYRAEFERLTGNGKEPEEGQ